MDRYRVAPRPVYLSAAAAAGGDHGDGPRRLPRGVAGGGGAELDIFSAERYFNADDVVKKEEYRDEEQPRQEVAVDAASQSGRTVACSSEASWTSRSGLLSGHAQSAASAGAAAKLQMGGANGGGGAAAAAAASAHRGKKPGSGQRWGLFSRDCPCAGRKAVTVDVASEPRSPATPRTHARFENSHIVADSTIFKANAPPPPPPCEEEPVKMKISPGSSTFPPPLANSIFAAAPNRGGGGGGAAPFAAFPAPDIVGRRVVSSGGFTFPVAVGAAKVVSTVGDEPPRESLEVFRPIDEESVLADPPADHLATVGGRGGGGGGLAAGFARAPGVAAVATDEEAMSDASSDLFDLESFAASSSFPTTCRGRSSRRNSREDDDDDEDLPYGAAAAAAAAVEPALSECMYAPSEVSVVWSVATAEGGAFDAASVANFSSAASACCVEEFSFVPPPDSAATAGGGGHEGFTAAMSRSAARKKGGGFLSSCRCEKAVSVGPTPVRMVRPEVNVKTTGGGAARYHPGRVRMPVRT